MKQSVIYVREVQNFLHPADSQGYRARTWRPGMPVSAFLPENEPCYAIVDGLRVESDYMLRPGDRVIVVHLPGDLTTVLVTIGISLLTGFASAALAPSVAGTARQRRERTVNSFIGIENTIANGASVPVIYGRHRIGGVLLNLFSRVVDQEGDRLWALIGLSEGPVKAIGDKVADADDLVPPNLPSTLNINDNDANGFTGTRASVRLGTGTQTHIPDFSDIGISKPENLNLPILDTVLDKAASAGQTFIVVKRTNQFAVSDKIWIDFSSGSKQESAVISSIGSNGRLNLNAALSFSHAVGDDVRRFTEIVVSPAEQSEAWDLNFLFPSGLYRIKSNGDRVTQQVNVQYRYRVSPGAWNAWTSIQFESKHIGPFRQTFRVDLPSKDQWEFGLRRITPEPGTVNASRDVTLDTVNVITHDALQYPFTALVGVKALATRQLNGGTPVFSVVVDGRLVPVWNNDNPPTFTDTWTQNPAWVMLDLFLSVRYGVGGDIDSQKNLDLQSFADFAAYCDEWIPDESGAITSVDVDSAALQAVLSVADTTGFVVGSTVMIGRDTPVEETGTILTIQAGVSLTLTANLQFAHTAADADPVEQVERRHQFDGVFDSPKKLWDSVARVGSVARAGVIKSNAKIRAFWDRPRSPVQLFSESNIVRGSFKMHHESIKDAPNAVEVSFLNVEKDYDQDTIRVVDPVAAADQDPLRVKSVSLYGIVRPSHANREARYILRRERKIRDRVEFQAGIDAVAAEAGDVVTLQYRSLSKGTAGRVQSSGAATVTVDFPITLETGKTYLAKVWQKTADIVEVANISSAPGTYAADDTLTVSANWTNQPETDAVIVIGEEQNATVDVDIETITTTPELKRKIVGHVYDPTVYVDVPEDAQTEQATWGGAGNDPLISSKAPVAVTSVTVLQQHVTLPDGTPRTTLLVSWDTAAGNVVVNYEVWLRLDNNAETGGDTIWELAGTTAQRFYTIRSALVDAGQTYTVAVVGIGAGGARLAPDVAGSAQVTISGLTPMDDGDLPTLSATCKKTPAGDFVSVTGGSLPGPQGFFAPPARVEARLGSSWLLGMPVYSGTSRQFVLPALPPKIADKLFIREQSKAGIWSQDAAVVDLSGQTKPANMTKAASVSEADGGFLGTKTNLSSGTKWDGTAFLFPTTASVTGIYESVELDTGVVPTLPATRTVWIVGAIEHEAKAAVSTLVDTLDSLAAKRRTNEGSIDSAKAQATLWIQWSDLTGGPYSEWKEYTGPVEVNHRYLKAKAEIVTSDLNNEPRLVDLRMFVADS